MTTRTTDSRRFENYIKNGVVATTLAVALVSQVGCKTHNPTDQERIAAWEKERDQLSDKINQLKKNNKTSPSTDKSQEAKDKINGLAQRLRSHVPVQAINGQPEQQVAPQQPQQIKIIIEREPATATQQVAPQQPVAAPQQLAPQDQQDANPMPGDAPYPYATPPIGYTGFANLYPYGQVPYCPVYSDLAYPPVCYGWYGQSFFIWGHGRFAYGGRGYREGRGYRDGRGGYGARGNGNYNSLRGQAQNGLNGRSRAFGAAPQNRYNNRYAPQQNFQRQYMPHQNFRQQAPNMRMPQQYQQPHMNAPAAPRYSMPAQRGAGAYGGMRRR